MALPGRTYAALDDKYKYGFNGKESDIDGEFDAYDFGARSYDERLGRWMSTDPKAMKYPSYSPYHAMYCNPIAVKDNDGEENIVVIGNQGDSPGSDKNPWYKFGEYRYGKNRRHFLERGIIEALMLKKFRTTDDEATTILVYEGDYTSDELALYAAVAKNLGINFKQVKTAKEIKDYINESGGMVDGNPSPNGRGDDLITDFTYVGHGGQFGFLVGHEHDEGQIINHNDLSEDAFHNSCNAKLLGCGNGVGKLFETFRDKLVGGTVFGPMTTMIWGGKGLGTCEPFDKEYYLPTQDRDSPERKDLPKDKRTRTEKGKAGKEGKINGKSPAERKKGSEGKKTGGSKKPNGTKNKQKSQPSF